MQRGFIVFAAIATFVSCTGKSSKKEFTVSGTIVNNTAKMIYLEEIPVATMQQRIADSAVLGKNGKYILNAGSQEASVYYLRLDKSVYPLAGLINDASKITLNATFNNTNKQFAESYEVKGSEASRKMKSFIYEFTNKLETLYYQNRKADSLQKTGVTDNALAVLQNENKKTTTEIRGLTLEYINKSNNPALTMFILGYYQTTSNNPGYQLKGLTDEEVNEIVSNAVTKFPSHKGLALIKKSLDEQMQKMQGLVGQPAPEISLPDVNGNEIKLSSFRGKYVLVDFWASWCKPCRFENPNVVKMYNKFRNKNFTVLGVSLDKDKDDWIKAIKKDGLTWTHISDLREWESLAVGLYHIEGIPYNVLVDPDGKIIAEALRGDMLEAKLQEVLK